MPLFALYQLWVLVLQPYLSAPRLQAGPLPHRCFAPTALACLLRTWLPDRGVPSTFVVHLACLGC